MNSRNFLIFLFIWVGFPFISLKAEILKTINVSMPTNYGTFFGEIHYSEKDLAIALRVERIIKEDLIKVINYFEYTPYDVVHFNIDPYIRLTNGNATSFPTNIINLYNFPANNWEHLIVMENWLQGLVLHEFMHITHLDQTRGYLKIGRKIFGTVAKVPAGIVPRWFTEGIAVWGESHLINGGRLGNQLFNKELLMGFNKNNFCKTIDCLDNPGDYPNGQLAYWAGAHFIEYLENKKPKTIKCLVEENSASLPFFLNNAFEVCAGEKAQDLFIKFREEYKKLGSSAIAEDSDKWGEKINNIFGSDDFQKGFVLDHDHLFKVEHNKQSEALVAYDLKDEVNFIGKYESPISDVVSMVDEEKENKMLLVSFNDDSNFRIENKVWKLINPDTLLVESTLNFPHDPSYVVPLGDNQFISFSYWENKWQVENGKELLKVFPSNYNLNLVKKVGDKLLLKINDANGFSSLVLSDFKLQQLTTIYRTDKMYDLPSVSEKFLVIREEENFKLLEWGKEIQLSSLPNYNYKDATFLSLSGNRSLGLVNELKSKTHAKGELENILKKEKQETKTVETSEFKMQPEPLESYASLKSESYPRLDHLIPHYWFLAVGSSDNLGSVGAVTTFSDPMEVYFLNATGLIYPSVNKVGGNLEYVQKMIKMSDMWRISAMINQDYSKTNFNSSLNTSRDFKLRSSYKFLFKQSTYIPALLAGVSTTEDFISHRTTKNIGVGNSFYYQALVHDKFFQYFLAGVNLQIDKPNIGESYLHGQINAEGGWCFNEKLSGSIKGSFSRLFKADFSRGVVYGGGISDITKLRVHEFYGIPYSNAYGNKIFTSRIILDYNFWDIYYGRNLIPFFFKEAHLLWGYGIMHADRIFLQGATLREKTISELFFGQRLKLNTFYHVPTSIDLVFSSTNNPNGKNVNQVNFTISADLM